MRAIEVQAVSVKSLSTSSTLRAKRCAVRIAWAEEHSRFTELSEVCAIRGLQAVRSKVQAQELSALSWGRWA